MSRKAVVEFAIERPAYGQLRASKELKRKGIFVSTRWYQIHLATPRSRDIQEAIKGSGSQISKRKSDPHRGTAASS